MAIPKKVIEFLEKNKDKLRTQIIKDMRIKFNYKKSTAMTYYSLYYKNTDVKTKIFDFLEENPEAVTNNVIKKYIEKLGVTKTTYLKYKGEYMNGNNIEIPENRIEYYNGRARETFQFDDSRLYG